MRHDSRTIARILCTLLVAAPAACGERRDGDGASWHVERTTVETVTTVRNVAGSAWGDDAVLVEEASIGILEGAPEYMLARPVDAWLTLDEVYVLDMQDHRVRVYDHRGGFVRAFGRRGQGPGELEWPMAVAVVGDRVLVANSKGQGRVSIFTSTGDHLEDWALGYNPAFEFFVTGEAIFTRRLLKPDKPTAALRRTQAFQAIGPAGFEGEVRPIPDLGDPTLHDVPIPGGTSYAMPVPFAPPDELWSIAPDGRLVVGFPDRYRFEIRDRHGALTTVVERVIDPVPVAPEEGAETVRLLAASLGPKMGDVDWDSIPVRATRPAYDAVAAHRDGRIWIHRSEAATRDPNCAPPAASGTAAVPEPCWRAETVTDVFAMNGSFLGRARAATGEPVVPVDVFGDRAVTIHESEDGAPLVRIYRIVTPEHDSD